MEKQPMESMTGIVHDVFQQTIETALSAVEILSQKIKNQDEPLYQTQYATLLHIARQNMRKALRNAQNLADIDALEKGTLALAPALLDPDRMLRALCTASEPAAQHMGVALHYACSMAQTCGFCCDTRILRRIVMNLLENALRHTQGVQNGSVWLRLAGDKTRVEISVTDNGEGVSAELQPRIFERGQTATACAPRMGLGLYLVQMMAQAHGGTVRFESVPHEKTTFTVTLPALSAAGGHVLRSAPETYSDVYCAQLASIELANLI